jgi:probable biosynthetic protein (TIGR04098 family)
VTAAPAAPEIARRLRIGMPQLDAGGLSENWLLRYAGDLHWEEISRRLEASSDQIRSDWGERLYPTFVAVRARYDVPLAAVAENEVLEASARVVPCGRACAHGWVTARVRGQAFALELLSTFALRERPGTLRMAHPAARLAARWTPMETPALARLARCARRGEPLDDPFAGPSLALEARPLGLVEHEPSPYADYNGAGLLYFASYVTIADSAERRLVHALGLAPGGDWALVASPVRRDVFYYGNLPLGQALTAELLSFTADGAGVTTRMRLRRTGGERMADLVTRRLFIEPRP